MLPSIPYVLARDSFRRGIYFQLTMLAVIPVLPIFLFTLLRIQGAEGDDPSIRVMIFRFMLTNAIYCCAAGMEYLTVRNHVYALPITTTKLVACQMIPAMVAVLLNMIFVTGVENIIFAHNFPLWGPACFSATAITACWATFWYTNKTIWQPFALLLVAGSLLLWYVMRFQESIEPLNDLTVLDFVIFAIIAVAGFCLGVAGLGRNRRGDDLQSDSFLCKAQFFFLEHSPASLPVLKTPQAAQEWYERRSKNWRTPLLIGAGLVVMFVEWLFDSRVPTKLLEELLSIGGAICFPGAMLCGVSHGLPLREREQFSGKPQMDLGQFLSTRPITNSGLSDALLKALGRTILISWTLWFASFLVVWIALWSFGDSPQQLLPHWFRWWYFPASLLGLWSLSTLVCSGIIMDNHKRLTQCVVVFGASAIVYALLWFYFSSRQKVLLTQVVASGLGILFIFVAGGLFTVARRNRLIAKATVVRCLAGWCCLSTFILFERFIHPRDPIAFSILAVGIAALAVAPFATAPLAIAKNRHR